MFDLVGAVAVDSQSVGEGALGHRVHCAAEMCSGTHRGR